MKTEFILIFFYFYLLSNFDFKIKKEYKNIVIISQILILTILAGIRQNTPDLNFYQDIYEKNLSTGIEIGYLAIQKVFMLLNFEFFIFKIFVSLISILLILTSIYSISYRPFLTIFIYYSLIYFEKPYIQMRNSLATGLFLFSIKYLILNQNKLKAFLIVLLSPLMHFTGYIYMVIYLIYFKIINNEIKILKIGFICIILSIIFIKLDYNFLLKLSEVELGIFSEKIKIYLFTENGKRQFYETKIGFKGIVSILLYGYYIATYRYNLEKKPIFIFIGSLSILFKLTAYKLTPFNRVIGIFDIIEPFIYSNLLNLNFKTKIENILYKVFYNIFIFIYCLYIFVNNIQILKI